VLGRARRRTVVIDSGEQSNRASPVIGGLLGYDQRPPAELYAAGRRELSSYASVEYRFGHVRRGSCGDGGFELEVDDGRPIHARRVLLTTGMQYCPPDIPGLAELWGTSVFQCPFCHGWEMRDKRLAALAAGDEAVHAALMLRGWSDDVVLLTDGRSDLSPADVNALRSADVVIDDRRIVEIIGRDGELTEIAFADGTRTGTRRTARRGSAATTLTACRAAGRHMHARNTCGARYRRRRDPPRQHGRRVRGGRCLHQCDEGAWTGRMGRRLRETGLQEHPLMAAAAA
jgi:thioredoxin reductase